MDLVRVVTPQDESRVYWTFYAHIDGTEGKTFLRDYVADKGCFTSFCMEIIVDY